ncbi:hypothetical protein SNE40_013142 [Patella caerulea]|uniref:Uncharacterized protein n=1 Tax=Patella caerulea TaxID=87958 RepID=A0AAN8JMJ2_PATCE
MATKKNSLEVIQLRQHYFKKYPEASRCMNFTSVPFSKMKAILNTKEEQFTVQFITSFDEGDGMKMASVRARGRKRRMSSQHGFSVLLTGLKLIGHKHVQHVS